MFDRFLSLLDFLSLTTLSSKLRVLFLLVSFTSCSAQFSARKLDKHLSDL